MSYYNISIENTLRCLVDGILTGDKHQTHGIYAGFDLGIITDKKVYDQREVRVGVHFLFFHGRILGAADRDFLMSRFHNDHPWESVSTHSSCWPDSFMGFINDIVRDVTEKKNKSKYVKPYKEDKLSFSQDNDAWVLPQGFQLLESKELLNVEFLNMHDCYRDEKPRKQKLIPTYAYSALGIAV